MNIPFGGASLVALGLALMTSLHADPAPSSATPPAARVVVLGDSLTAGPGLAPDETYPALLQTKVREANLPFTVANAGVSGDTSAGGLRRLAWLLKQPIDILVLELGANDALRGVDPAETHRNLLAIIDRLKEKSPDAKILLIGMRMPGSMGEDYAAKFAAVYTEVAKERQTVFLPFLLEGVAARPELNMSDGVHPNAAGHKILSETVWKALEPMLVEARPAAAKS